MEAGYGVGDFIAVLKLVNDVRKRFVNAPGQFQVLSEDVKSLSNVLRDIEDFELESGLNGPKSRRLNGISRGCYEALKELEEILDRYQELQPGNNRLRGIQRRVWRRLQWNQNDTAEVQDRVHRSIDVFNLFLNGLSSHLAIATKEEVREISQHHDYQARQAVINWLAPISYATQQSDFLSQLQPGTGEWLFSSKEFHQWMSFPRMTLFCPGIPGAGKTVLTSAVVDYVEEKFQLDQSVGIAYFYCNFRQRDEHTLDNLLASLLKQLLDSRGPLPGSVQSLYDRHRRKSTRPTLRDLSKVLLDVASEYSRVFVLVDALDEYQISDRSVDKMLSEIFHLQKSCNVSYFATSRHNPNIESAFENCLRLEIRADTDDVRRYLLGHLDQLPSFVSQNPRLQSEIIDAIVNAVDGMFLLAHLHMSALIGKRSPKAIKSTLRNLPSGSDAYDIAYQDAMYRIQGQHQDQKEMAIQILSWITCAQRPLSVDELQHALAVEVGEPNFDPDNCPDIPDMVSVCAGLVIVDERSRIIRLVHYTAQEYYERTWMTWFPKAHSDISKICVTYLSYDTFRSGRCSSDHEYKRRIRTFPFYQYSATSWGYHARQRLGDKERLLAFLQDGVKVKACSQVISIEQRPSRFVAGWSQRVPRGVSGIHLAAHYGMKDTINDLLKIGQFHDTKDSAGQTPLLLAARNGHEDTVRFLVGRGADLHAEDESGMSPFASAAENGCASIVRMLLREGADPVTRDSIGRTPMSLAAENNHDEVVSDLLQYGIDHDVDSDGQTPLLWASRYGNETTVRLLLEAGADPNPRDVEYGWTALSWAAGNGYDGVVRLLLEKGADAACEDSLGRTPLLWASQNGHAEIVQLLIDARLDADCEDANGMTPLALAVENGHEAATNTLLNGGASLDVRDDHRHTRLHSAVYRGMPRYTKALLDSGVDPNLKHHRHGNPAIILAVVRGNFQIVRLLLEYGADVNVQESGFGRTPILFAAVKGNPELVKVLLDAGANPNRPDYSGRMPLLYAAADGYRLITRLLLEAGTNVDMKDVYGRTALFAVVAGGDLEVVQMVLDRKPSDLKGQDIYGRDALYEAERRRHKEVAKLLLGRGTSDGGLPLEAEQDQTVLQSTKWWCDVCLVNIPHTEPSFHCDVCQGGDFDICKYCIESGASCPGEGHEAVEMKQRQLKQEP